MVLNLLQFLNLIAFGFIVSQPVFYLMAMSKVQKSLEAPSYLALRNLLDQHIQVNLRVGYYATLVTNGLLVVLSAAAPTGLVFISSLIAFAALVIDMVLIVKGNVPLNKVISQWSADSYPVDWRSVREKWFYYYQRRQVAGIVGFVSLLAGAAFR